MKILNDLHLGVERTAGTTKQSKVVLREMQSAVFEMLMPKESESLMILGDLFDTAVVPLNVLMDTYTTLSNYLRLHDSNTLYLVAGNHDISKDQAKLSSMNFLANLLELQFKQRIVYVTEGCDLTNGVGVLGHYPNQELFDLALERAAEKYTTILLHCNYDNHFATLQDHSLNLTKEQAVKFDKVIIAHEHEHREIDNVVALGCQQPTSIADCLGGSKFCWYLRDGELKRELTWPQEYFLNYDWESVEPIDDSIQFVRVEGKASAAQAGEVTRKIAKLRRTNASVFVFSNAVVIEGMTISDNDMVKAEDISELDILTMLYDKLKPWQVDMIKEIL